MPLVLGIRAPLAALRSRRRPPVGLLEPSRLALRVRPGDCDTYLHVNNGRYLSLMDLGRVDHAGRCGLIDAFRREQWKPVAGGATIRFRRELRLGARYQLVTRCVGWDDGWAYFEQVFERADGSLAARAYAKVATLDTHGTRVAPARVVAAAGFEPASPPLPDGVAAWQSSQFG